VRTVNFQRQFWPELNVGKMPAKVNFARFRMAASQPCSAKLANGGTHMVGELEPPPSRRPTYQFDQHPLGFGTCVGRLRSLHDKILAPSRTGVEKTDDGDTVNLGHNFEQKNCPCKRPRHH
jgi:hypothetical protein